MSSVGIIFKEARQHVMPSEPKLVRIAPSYVRRSMSVALIAGLFVPVIGILLMFRLGFNPDLAFGLLVSLIVLLWAVAKIYRRGLTQTIQLLPDRIVFDYITYLQEYSFGSATEWKLEEAGKNWCLTALKDGSTKLIPMSAFPGLQKEIQNYYRRKA